MSSDALWRREREEQAEPAPPVKKRGRYAQPDSLTRGSTPSSSPQRPGPPDGFVRYELDEEDSDEDPDFEADILDEEDEDDEPYDVAEDAHSQSIRDDAQQADAELSHILRGGRASDVNESEANEGVRTAFPASQGLFAHQYSGGEDIEPQFDVDDLESSDDDGAEQNGISSKEYGTPGADSLDIYGRDGDYGSEVEDVDDAELEEGDDGDVDEAEGGADDGPAEDYVRFLLGLVENDGTRDQAENLTGANGQEYRAASAANNATQADELRNFGMEDDDDFDYLRESARVQDDPLEYRDDLHVSRKELVHLLFNTRESNLRRQTRRSRYRHAQARRQSQSPFPLVPQAPGPTASGQATPGSTVPVAGAFAPYAAAVPGAILAAPSIGQPMPAQQAVSTFPVGTFVNISPQALHAFQEQLSIHIQLLVNVHAVSKKKTRQEREGRNQDSANSGSASHSQSHEVAQRSEVLLRGLIENRRISVMYHETMATNMSRLRGFADRMLYRNRTTPFAYQSCKSSVYNMPILNHLQAFLQDCAAAALQDMPDGALSRLRPFFRPDILASRSTRPPQRQYSSSGSRPGWFVWTASDDTLLAMTMAKYGSDVGQFSSDLLPHRKEDDCQTRVRYLSSRRCPDNPVKRQAMFIATPLNQGELALVQRGLELYGNGGEPDENVWKEIQRKLLPNREWSHLQKLWSWRETRRKYKAKYRAKASQKKKALREASARS